MYQNLRNSSGRYVDEDYQDHRSSLQRFDAEHAEHHDSGHSRDSSARPPRASPGKAVRSSRGGVDKAAVSSKRTSSFPKDEQVAFLKKQGFPFGLAQGLVDNILSHPVRFWVVDNSGSMMASDGETCMLGSATSSSRDMIQVVSCTRWLELQETVAYHAQLSGTLQSATIFRVSLHIVEKLIIIVFNTHLTAVSISIQAIK